MRAVNFKVFTVNWPSAKLSSLQNFGLLQLESKIHMKRLPVFDTCKGWLHASSLPAAATEAISEVITRLATSLRLLTMVEAVDHGWGCGPWLRLWTMVEANHYTFQSILYDPSSGLWHFLGAILMNVYFLCTFLNV